MPDPYEYLDPEALGIGPLAEPPEPQGPAVPFHRGLVYPELYAAMEPPPPPARPVVMRPRAPLPPPGPPPVPLPPEVGTQYGGAYFAPEAEAQAATRRYVEQGGDIAPLTAAIQQRAAAKASPQGQALDLSRLVAGGQARQLAYQAGLSDLDAQAALEGQLAAKRRSAEELQAADEQQKAAQARETAMAAEMDRLRAATEKVSTSKVDPDRYYKNRSTGEAIMAHVAGMLGGWIAGTKGGSNFALDEINKRVDRDIAAQQADLESGKAGLAARSTILGQMSSQFDDMDRAKAASKIYLFNSLDSDIQSMLSGVQNKGAQMRGQALRDQIAQGRAELEAQLKLQAAAAEEQRRIMAAQAAAGRAQAQEREAVELEKLGGGWEEYDRKEVRPLLVPQAGLEGETLIANTPENAQKLKEETIELTNLNLTLQELGELAEKARNRGGGFRSDEAKKFDRLRAHALELKSLAATTRLSETSLELQEAQIPEAGSIFGKNPIVGWGNPVAGIQQMRQLAQRELQTRINAYGAAPYKERIIRDPKTKKLVKLYQKGQPAKLIGREEGPASFTPTAPTKTEQGAAVPYTKSSGETGFAGGGPGVPPTEEEQGTVAPSRYDLGGGS